MKFGLTDVNGRLMLKVQLTSQETTYLMNGGPYPRKLWAGWSESGMFVVDNTGEGVEGEVKRLPDSSFEVLFDALELELDAPPTPMYQMDSERKQDTARRPSLEVQLPLIGWHGGYVHLPRETVTNLFEHWTAAVIDLKDRFPSNMGARCMEGVTAAATRMHHMYQRVMVDRSAPFSWENSNVALTWFGRREDDLRRKWERQRAERQMEEAQARLTDLDREEAEHRAAAFRR